jgi:cell division protein FtsQ
MDATTVIDERIAQRRRAVRDQERRRRLRRSLIALGAIGGVVLRVIGERSDLVALETIEVVGTERLDEDAVLAAADLAPETSTVRLRLGSATERVVDLTLVRRATIRRTGPRSVAIEVEERRPVLAVRGAGTEVLVDRDGWVIDTGALEGLPSVTLRRRPPEVGAPVAEDPALANAFVAWRGLSGPLRARVVGLDAVTDAELTLVLDTGERVRFGRAERLDEKARALGAILQDLGDVRVATIDVRTPTAPVVVPR